MPESGSRRSRQATPIVFGGANQVRNTEPTLDAWKIDYRLITKPAQLMEIADHFRRSRENGFPACVLIAEGKA